MLEDCVGALQIIGRFCRIWGHTQFYHICSCVFQVSIGLSMQGIVWCIRLELILQGLAFRISDLGPLGFRTR